MRGGYLGYHKQIEAQLIAESRPLVGANDFTPGYHLCKVRHIGGSVYEIRSGRRLYLHRAFPLDEGEYRIEFQVTGDWEIRLHPTEKVLLINGDEIIGFDTIDEARFFALENELHIQEVSPIVDMHMVV